MIIRLVISLLILGGFAFILQRIISGGLNDELNSIDIVLTEQYTKCRDTSLNSPGEPSSKCIMIMEAYHANLNQPNENQNYQ